MCFHWEKGVGYWWMSVMQFECKGACVLSQSHKIPCGHLHRLPDITSPACTELCVSLPGFLPEGDPEFQAQIWSLAAPLGSFAYSCTNGCTQ